MVPVGQRIYGNLGLRNSIMVAVIVALSFLVSDLLPLKGDFCKKLVCSIELLIVEFDHFVVEVFLSHLEIG